MGPIIYYLKKSVQYCWQKKTCIRFRVGSLNESFQKSQTQFESIKLVNSVTALTYSTSDYSAELWEETLHCIMGQELTYDGTPVCVRYILLYQHPVSQYRALTWFKYKTSI